MLPSSVLYDYEIIHPGLVNVTAVVKDVGFRELVSDSGVKQSVSVTSCYA